MSYAVISNSAARRQKYFAFALSCAFISGFLAGVYLAASNTSHYISLIHSAVATAPPVIGVFAQTAVFFSMTALFSKTGRGYLFLILCFLQAFSFGIASTTVYYSFGSAYWLIQGFMLFTKTVTLISLLWFWLRNISGQSHNFQLDLLLSISASVLAGVLDLCLVSSFLLRLFI